MTLPSILAGVRDSYLAASLTVAIAIGVVLVSRIPLAAPVEVDLSRYQSFRATSFVTMIGVFWPTPEGGTTNAPVSRLVFNRPLPASLELSIRGRCDGECGTGDVAIVVGDRRYAASFAGEDSDVAVRIENPDGAREIAIENPPQAKLVIRRFSVEPWDPGS